MIVILLCIASFVLGSIAGYSLAFGIDTNMRQSPYYDDTDVR